MLQGNFGTCVFFPFCVDLGGEVPNMVMWFVINQKNQR
jgi:hypothetical protein